MKKNLARTESEKRQHFNAMETESHSNQKDGNPRHNQNAYTQWMPGSCRCSSPDNKFI